MTSFIIRAGTFFNKKHTFLTPLLAFLDALLGLGEIKALIGEFSNPDGLIFKSELPISAVDMLRGFTVGEALDLLLARRLGFCCS